MPPRGFHTCLGAWEEDDGYGQTVSKKCTNLITWRFALCRSCEERFTNRTKNWPPWLRWMWSDIQRERRRNIKINDNESWMMVVDDERGVVPYDYDERTDDT